MRSLLLSAWASIMIELQSFSLKNYKTQEEYRAFIQEKVRTQNVNICAT